MAIKSKLSKDRGVNYRLFSFKGVGTPRSILDFQNCKIKEGIKE